MKLKELKIIGIETLTKYGVEDTSTKVNLLLQYILKLNKIELVMRAEEVISEEQKESFFKYLEELKNGRPIQYITNSQEFMGLNFYVDENVLIPQPDTEILVENTINVVKELMKDKEFASEGVNPLAPEPDIREKNNIIEILDLCTGSGAIAVSIEDYIFNKNETKEIVEIYASDVSKKALEIAKKNAIANNKNSKINFILSDMFDEITTKDFDIIVSNPPYIETQTIGRLSKEVQNEPILALDGGKDGLEYYRIIAKEAKKHLKDDGYILLEIGYNQKEKVMNIFDKEKYLNLVCKKDLSGNDRIIECRYSDKGRKICLFHRK